MVYELEEKMGATFFLICVVTQFISSCEFHRTTESHWPPSVQEIASLRICAHIFPHPEEIMKLTFLILKNCQFSL